MVTTREVRTTSLNHLVRELEGLALGENGWQHTFRGHRSAAWRLDSTLARHSTSRLHELLPTTIDYHVKQFVEGLARLGRREMIDMPKRARLEIARHHGVPSPLIDMTRSPFIALWFAYNGVRGSVDEQDVAVYALNWNNLAIIYSILCKGSEAAFRTKYKKLPLDYFRWEIPKLFEDGYPNGLLKFIPHAHSLNRKMQRQKGCFLYDTLEYESLGVRDVQGLIEESEVGRRFGEQDTTLTKITAPAAMAREVFQYLDLLGINGAMLMDDYTGVAADVANTFNHNPQESSWDIWESDAE